MVIGLRLLAIIVAIEFFIMVVNVRFAPHALPWELSLFDVLVPAVLSSVFIYWGVFQPLHAQVRKNELLSTALSQLNTGVLITDNSLHDNPIIYANPAFLRITGYDESEVLGRNPRFLKGQDSIQEVAKKVSRSLREQRPVDAVQKNYRKDGAWYWNEMKISPVLDARGRAAYYIGLSNEVTQRVEMEQRLSELAQAVQQAGEAIVIVNRKGEVEFVNPTFCRSTGYEFAELRLQEGVRYLSCKGGSCLLPSEVRHALESGQVWSGRHEFRRKDGTRFDCLSSIAPIRNPQGEITHYVGVHRDISELVGLENKLVQAKKMEAIGTLVGGIAHDFNNILASMLGNAYLVKAALDKDSKAASRIQAIETQGYHAAHMIQQLLAFARKGKVNLIPVTLNDLLHDAVQMASVNMPSGVELACTLAEASPVVRGDSSLLQQAVVNLVNNARDAVAESPEPHIEVCVEQLDDSSAEVVRAFPESDMPDGTRYACVRVRDNGKGMDKVVMERVFDPFFTTKPMGKGTGLGMAMVKGSVEMHMGQISVSSEPGKGTEFTIILPCADVDDMRANMHERAMAGSFPLPGVMVGNA